MVNEVYNNIYNSMINKHSSVLIAKLKLFRQIITNGEDLHVELQFIILEILKINKQFIASKFR
ncbi:hypothetical protein DERP_008536 [Dermatophagoides pteronyssinus]|uniref:Uncharacterized protein n=1 Tax=Dermatophagoides pteronyssinus TaxID=6956 RepID=A0ABQ8IWL1_DERPT|nr:hypothetical protein DERP_008536 [Dermatophagoides pteronyssinus]